MCICVCPFYGHAVIHFVAVRGAQRFEKRDRHRNRGVAYNVGKAEVVVGDQMPGGEAGRVSRGGDTRVQF